MKDVLILDTSVASFNRGDDIIMACFYEEMAPILEPYFQLTLPTHVASFHAYQSKRNSRLVKRFRDARLKFVGGSNILLMDLMNLFPQWRINIFNYHPVKNSILVAAGASRSEKPNRYTNFLYQRVLSKEYHHSTRDQRTKTILENMGFKAINTGCVTTWKLTNEFCSDIPSEKAKEVIFTLTAYHADKKRDLQMIETLKKNYDKVHFWIQDKEDIHYLKSLMNIQDINIVSPTLEAYQSLLKTDIDYIGTRLHGGIYAMRHLCRTIIISIDERAAGMSQTCNLKTLKRSDMDILDSMINSEWTTQPNIDIASIEKWKKQFI